MGPFHYITLVKHLFSFLRLKGVDIGTQGRAGLVTSL
jgi:hypothetical protein